MENPWTLLRKRERDYVQLATANSKEVNAHNEKILLSHSVIGGMLMMLPILSVPFSKTKSQIIPAYLLCSMLFFLIFLIFRFPSMRKYTLLGLYFCSSILFSLAIYLSVVHTPTMRATVLLGAFCVIPLGFIDKPVRMNLYIVSWLIIHTVLAFFLKPQYALDDAINCACFAFLGCFIGDMMIWTRVKGYEAHRLLIKEKETDVLTGIFSRRKLYETLIDLERDKAEKPSGVMMIDIDHFKSLNDSYGHATGDKCLSELGAIFIKFSREYKLQFYRYGGEEFAAFGYGYNEKELLEIAEHLRVTVQGTDMGGFSTTISVGVSYCGDESVKNYECVIDRADKAVYNAKRSGRNRVCKE